MRAEALAGGPALVEGWTVGVTAFGPQAAARIATRDSEPSRRGWRARGRTAGRDGSLTPRVSPIRPAAREPAARSLERSPPEVIAPRSAGLAGPELAIAGVAEAGHDVAL